jgi:polyhydroxyalkanoate synthase
MNAEADRTQSARINEAVEKVLSRNIDGLKSLEGLDLDLGVTPKDIIYSRDTMKLYHYRPICDEVYRVPVVLVMSLINRYYIVDLSPGQSLVEYLLQQGLDVYLIDWGVPRAGHEYLMMDHYVGEYIPECLERVAEESGESEYSMVGYCLGGVMACMHAALNQHGGIKNLGCFATPVDASGMSLYKRWADSDNFDIDRLVDELGNVPPAMVDAMLQALRPLHRSAGRMSLLDNVSNDEFVKAHYRFDRWTSDPVPLAGEVARQLFKHFLRDNKFIANEFEVKGEKVDLKKITCPFLHVAATHDHIVPALASKDIINRVGSKDKLEIVVKGGHVSLVAGGNAVYRLWPQLRDWLGQRSV